MCIRDRYYYDVMTKYCSTATEDCSKTLIVGTFNGRYTYKYIWQTVDSYWKDDNSDNIIWRDDGYWNIGKLEWDGWEYQKYYQFYSDKINICPDQITSWQDEDGDMANIIVKTGTVIRLDTVASVLQQ